MVFRDSNYKILEKAVINLENLSEDSNIGVVISELEKKGFTRSGNLPHDEIYSKTLEFIESRKILELDAAAELLPFAVDYLKKNILKEKFHYLKIA